MLRMKEDTVGLSIGKRLSGMLIETVRVAWERVLRYGVIFTSNLKMFVFRLKMDISTLKMCIFKLEMKLKRQVKMSFSYGETGLERDLALFSNRLYRGRFGRKFIRCL